MLETCQHETMIDLVDKRVLDSQGFRNEREDETKCDEADEQLVFEYFGERQRLPLDEERKSTSNKDLHFTPFGELPDNLAFEIARDRIGGVVNQAGCPGYNNERGGGQRCDEQFAEGKSRTCNFTIRDLLQDMIGNTSVNGQMFCSFKVREMMHLHQPSSEIGVPLDAQCLLIKHGLMNREDPIGGRTRDQ